MRDIICDVNYIHRVSYADAIYVTKYFTFAFTFLLQGLKSKTILLIKIHVKISFLFFRFSITFLSYTLGWRRGSVVMASIFGWRIFLIYA